MDAPTFNAADFESQIGRRLLALRQAQGLSLEALAQRSGVSKAMISRIERATSASTATLLGRLAAGLGVAITDLLAPEAPVMQRLRTRHEQLVWRDPQVGYLRRQVAPPEARNGIELVEIELPRAARVTYPAWKSRPYSQRLWLVEGSLAIDYGHESFKLAAGDCLDFGVDRALTYRALGPRGCRYLLVISPA